MRIIGNDPDTSRETQVVASGTLSTGDKVVVNSDGTVSVVDGVIGGVGSSVEYNSRTTDELAAAYDANAQKVVFFYQDGGNSNYGTAVVGTVSGTSISFGSPVVFESNYSSTMVAVYDTNAQKVVVGHSDNQNHVARVGTISGTSISFGSKTTFQGGTAVGVAVAYDSTNNKVVFVYGDSQNSTYGTGIVGTVSGTSISFGSETTFDTNGYCSYFGAAYDANSQKVVAAYLNSSDTQGYAVVGTVSGTSISFGSRVLFNAGRQENIRGVVYDANAQKVVIAYRDGANSNYGTAIVGTVSGTSISFGSKVVFNAASTEVPCATYDSNLNKVVIAYKDQDGTNYGKAIVGTVSGTSISFDPEETFATSDASKIAIAFDANAQASAISYRNSGNSNYGTGVVFKVGSTNLTDENYIGTASSPAADGDSIVVNTQGTVDDNQTGLTAGQSYYVQPDGTLSTTAGDPSVFAGTAVSSTKLIVKG